MRGDFSASVKTLFYFSKVSYNPLFIHFSLGTAQVCISRRRNPNITLRSPSSDTYMRSISPFSNERIIGLPSARFIIIHIYIFIRRDSTPTLGRCFPRNAARLGPDVERAFIRRFENHAAKLALYACKRLRFDINRDGIYILRTIPTTHS